MNLYKVLLVDDEEDVRSAIARKLDWVSLGFEVVGEAGNGQEALELCERLLPDVVMTDIKMPFMDGLELCRQAKALLPGVRVAIFSGFDEFEYAKEAITQQVEEYILKPIDAAELTGVFRRIRESLDAEIAARRDVERLRRHYEESLPLMQQQLLFQLLEGGTELEAALSRAGAYGLELDAAEYCVAVIRHEQEEAVLGGDLALAPVSLRQLITDTIPAGVRYYMAPAPDRVTLLFLPEAQSGARYVMALLGQLFPVSRRLLGLRLSIGVGKAYRHADEISLSYKEALSALDYQLLVEPGQCVYIGDIEPGEEGASAPDGKYADAVLRQIKIGGEAELEAAVTGLVRHLKDQHTSIQQYQIYLLELFTELLRLIRTYRMDPEEARQDELLAEGIGMRFGNLDQMGHWLFGICNNLRALARRERKDSARQMVERARELIAAQYADSELSLDSICSQLAVSPAYFSTLFKKETGEGFVAYLTDLRMEKALELLTTTDDKTYQIAEKIGYVDPNYFSYVFKRKFGASPSKYKTDRMKGNEPTA